MLRKMPIISTLKVDLDILISAMDVAVLPYDLQWVIARKYVLKELYYTHVTLDESIHIICAIDLLLNFYEVWNEVAILLELRPFLRFKRIYLEFEDGICLPDEVVEEFFKGIEHLMVLWFRT